LYWELTGEPPTNPTEFKGQLRMGLGKWIEEGFINHVIKNLHMFGLHSLSPINNQIQIGMSSPNIDGNLDDLLVERIGEEMSKPYVLELKTTYGIGGDILYNNMQPKIEHLGQMGVYLKDLSNKGVTNKGILLYIILSDKNFSEFIQFDCEYSNGVCRAYKARTFNQEHDVSLEINIDEKLDRLTKLKEYISKKELPPVEHYYKTPLTSEFLKTVTENHLKKALDGVKILGDWQISYSRYLDKHLEIEGSTRRYTAEEKELIREEYERRHPKTRKYKKQ